MNLYFNDFLFVLLAYMLTKFGYLVLFHNFFHLVSLKGKKAEGTYLEKFSRILGYALVLLGIVTASLILVKRIFPSYYLHGYLIVVVFVFLFLIYKFYSYKREERSFNK